MPGQPQVGGDVGGDEQHEGVEGDVDADPRADRRAAPSLRVAAQHLDDRRRLPWRAYVLDLTEQRALRDRHPDPQTDEHQQPAEQERHPPAPGQERLVGGQHAHQRQHPVGQQQADRHADLRPAGVEPAALGVAGLQGHQDRTAPLAAEAQPLQEAQQHQQDRRPDPDRRVGRQQADRERGDAHQQQGHDQDVLAADLVAVVAEDHAAERPGDEPDGVGGEGQQGADQRLEAGEEQLVEDQRGGGAVDEEVVPLQRRADQAGDDDLAHRRRLYRALAGGLAVQRFGHARPPVADAGHLGPVNHPPRLSPGPGWRQCRWPAGRTGLPLLRPRAAVEATA